MAITHKSGLEYFPMDVDFFSDEKIEFAAARFGTKGELIAIKLLCKIYRNGYYSEWSEDDSILFAKRAGENITPALVNEVVQELVKRGFFDKLLLDSFGILTSKGIQRRYFQATERRKTVEVFKSLLLIDLSKFQNVDILDSDVYIFKKNDDIKGQKKVEESKRKESTAEKPDALVLEFENLVVTKQSVFAFIRDKNPQFIEPYMKFWNFFAQEYKKPQVKKISKERRKKFGMRIKDESFKFIDILRTAKDSSFLKDSQWFCFDWIIENENNYLKVIEGNYNDSKNSKPPVEDPTEAYKRQRQREEEEYHRNLGNSN